MGGMQEVVRQLSERLAAIGHDVTVATRKHPDRISTEVNGVKIVDFEISGNLVTGIEGDRAGYENFLLSSRFDVVTFFAAQQWATDVALPVLDRIHGKKVSVPTGYSGLYWPGYAGYFEKMKTWIHGYDMNVYLSDDYRDINFARANGVTRLVLIPNGAGEDEFLSDEYPDVRQMFGLPPDCFLVLHVGSYTGWKGHHDAMEIFLRSGLKNAVLLMIGNNTGQFAISKKQRPLLWILKRLSSLAGSKRIIMTSVSREVTVAAYKQADLFLFPSNIECSPIVLFECAAAGLPFLATDVGNSPEIAGWTEGGVILPTTKDRNGFSHANLKGSVEALNELYRDTTKRKGLSERSFRRWRELYSWEKITLRYEKLYKDLLTG